jgi:CRISPR-associated protein Cmr2
MRYLLSLSIGPVQEFIAAARKTADLQAGSQLLVQTAKRVAETIKDQGSLIFPAGIESDDIPNKILIELNDGVDPEQAARDAKQAAQTFLKEQWDKAKPAIPSQYLDAELADRQVEGFLEFYAAWVPMNGAYAQERQSVERLLAGRKALRDFEQPLSRTGRPKSPLDPTRDCVLADGESGRLSVPKSCQRPPLSLKPSETLDAISLLKRVLGTKASQRKQPFSTSMMAARAYLQNLPDELLSPLKELADDLEQGEDYSDLLYPERVDDLLEELEKSEEEAKEFKNRAKKARRAVLDYVKKSEFPAYYAVLAADGDRMGKRLSEKETSEAHREFSRKLAEFAGEARRVIAKDFCGHCVYTGGDDILALLPVTKALDCARELASLFHQKVGATLSVGVAIVHHLENLQTSIERARAAEREAKKTRNALAVALHTRGGAPVLVSEPWEEAAFHEWGTWIKAFRGSPKADASSSQAKGLARGFPYELLTLAREWTQELDMALLRQEAMRILARKEGSQKPHLPERLHCRADWETFARKLVIARFIAGLTLEGEAS